jgi:transposase InsO family protein
VQGYREGLHRYGLVSSMGRRGNPYDNPEAESVLKTLKVEAVFPMAYEPSMTSPTIFRDSLTRSTTPAVSTQRWAISARKSSSNPRPTVKSAANPFPAKAAPSICR